MSALWEREDFRRVAQGAWRPGGTALTRRGLAPLPSGTAA